MGNYRPDIPHVDDSVAPGKLHERCEKVAIPDFDWLTQPIVAVVDGLTHLGHRRDPQDTDQND